MLVPTIILTKELVDGCILLLIGDDEKYEKIIFGDDGNDEFYFTGIW